MEWRERTLAKRLSFISFIFSVLFLCSCSITTANSDRDQEVKILDENLDLKAEIADLEEEIERLKRNYEITESAEEDVYLFLQAMRERNMEELKRRVAGNAQLDVSGIIFNNGKSLSFEEDNQDKEFVFVRLSDEEGDIETGKLVYDVLPKSDTTQNLRLEFIRQQDTWKVTNFSKQHL